MNSTGTIQFEVDLQTEIPEDMNLNIGTYVILKKLEATGAVSFQPDSSPKYVEIQEQLKVIAGSVGYILLNFQKSTEVHRLMVLIDNTVIAIDSDLI